MRLFLHGRLGTVKLLERIERAQKDESTNESLETNYPFQSTSTSVSWSSSSSLSPYYSSLLLSNWNMEEMDEVVVHALESFLRTKYTEIQQDESPKERIRYDDVLVSSYSFSSVESTLTTSLSSEENVMSDSRSREVILQNCKGQDRLEELIAMLMKTTSSLTIRYDTQQKLPIQVAKGLLKGAQQITENARELPDGSHTLPLPRITSLTLKGTTITPLTSNYLQMALPLLRGLEKLVLHGNFTLFELDAHKTSIIGHEYPKMVHITDSLHRILRELPRLKHLDLQRCHLPDEFLADILDALNPESIETLKLKGNMAHDESQHVLYRILCHNDCRLQHLDLSWQRLSNAKRNYSILDIGMLSSALEKKNASLVSLNISENRLLDEDIQYLSAILPIHPRLSTLRLQDCRITDRGMQALAYCLPKCSDKLKHFFLDGRQKIRDPVSVRKTIFESLLHNVYLRELALPDEIKCKSIDWVLELNRAGRRALLAEPKASDCSDPAIECTISAAPSFDSQTGANHIQDTLWPRVLERADRISRQEYLSQESSTTKAASTIYLLLREKGFHSILH